MNKLVKGLWIIATLAILLTLTVFTLLFDSLYRISGLNILDENSVFTTLVSGTNSDILRSILFYIAVFSIIAALIMLIVSIAIRGRQNAVELEDDYGKVIITDEAVKANVISTMKQYDHLIKSPDANVKIINRRQPIIKVKASCYTYEPSNLEQLGEDMKNSIKASLENMTHTPVKSVELKFLKTDRKNKNRVI